MTPTCHYHVGVIVNLLFYQKAFLFDRYGRYWLDKVKFVRASTLIIRKKKGLTFSDNPFLYSCLSSPNIALHYTQNHYEK